METATGAEISLRYRTDTRHLTLNLFHTQYDDYIYEASTGESRLTDEGDSLLVSRFTPADSIFQGFEVDIGTDLGQWNAVDLKLDASLEYVEARLTGGGKAPLPRIPPLGATLGLSADAGHWGLRGEAEYAHKKTTLAQGELPSDGFVLLNGFAHYDVSDAMTLRVSVHNLTNQEARQHSSFLKETTPMHGRNFKASLSVSF